MKRTLAENTLPDNFNWRTQRARNDGPVPGLFLMTDARLPDPLGAARALPRGSAIVVRALDDAKNHALFAALTPIARQSGLCLLATNPLSVRTRYTARGVHLSEEWLKCHPRRQRLFLPKNFIVTVSAHDRAAFICAIRFGADAIVASSLHASASHPGKKGLSFWRFYAAFNFNHLSGPLRQRGRDAKIIALGGVTPKDMARLRVWGVWAVAGIDLFAHKRKS